MICFAKSKTSAHEINFDFKTIGQRPTGRFRLETLQDTLSALLHWNTCKEFPVLLVKESRVWPYKLFNTGIKDWTLALTSCGVPLRDSVFIWSFLDTWTHTHSSPSWGPQWCWRVQWVVSAMALNGSVRISAKLVLTEQRWRRDASAPPSCCFPMRCCHSSRRLDFLGDFKACSLSV